MQVWDDDLETIATDWTTACQEDPPDDFVNLSPYTDVGFALGVSSSLELMIESWDAQGENYTYDNNTCSSDCEAYLQLVWDESMAVGCYSWPCGGALGTLQACAFSSK